MKKILSLLSLAALTIGLLGSCCKKEDPKVSETKTMAEILKTATGIPESQNLTPPANAWVNSTDSDCKAFIGVDAEGDKLFVILKVGLESAPLKICMDDAFARIDDNTYQRVKSGVGTFTIQMAEGKFTSYKFEAVSGSAYEQFNGTYSAPAASIAFDESPFEPGNIKVGQTLTIKGKNLNLVTKVVFCDNVEVTNFKSQSSEQIVIENFPVKARTGKVTLVSGTTSQEVTSDTDLVVAQPSVSEIYQFTEVTPKQKLTINGENFDLVCDAIIGDDVYLDYIVSNEGHTIEIEMPEEVHDGTVKVIACSGVEVTVATVTAAPTISTIADVLATAGDNAPSAANHWNDTKGNYIYVDGGNLSVYVSSASGSVSVPLDRTVTPNGDNYLYSEGVLSFTFNMTEGVLTSIYVNCSVYGVNDTFSPAGTLEYVEIGGVKWATKNLGAEKVTDYGDYFAWGATELAYSSLSSNTFTFVASRPASYGGSGWTQSSGFAKVNTPYYDGSAYTKYTSSDSKTVLESDDDAATALLGSGWRMPTTEEFNALYDACLNGSYDTTTNPSGASASVGKGVYWCTSYDGVAGCLFCDGTNKLFFPAAGDGYGASLNLAGSGGGYWSSSLYTGNTGRAYYLGFSSDGVEQQGYTSRCEGFSVRPVKAAAAGDPGNGTEQYKNNSNPDWFSK